MKSNLSLLVWLLGLSVVYSALEIQEYIKFRPSQRNKLIQLRVFSTRTFKCPFLKSWKNNQNVVPITREEFIKLAKENIKYHKPAEVKKYVPYTPSRRKYVTTIKPYLSKVITSTIEPIIVTSIDDAEVTSQDYTTESFPALSFTTEYATVTTTSHTSIENIREELENNSNEFTHSTTEDPDLFTTKKQVISIYGTTTSFARDDDITKSDSDDSTTRDPNTETTQTATTGLSAAEESATQYTDIVEMPTTYFGEEFLQATTDCNESTTLNIDTTTTTNVATEMPASKEFTAAAAGPNFQFGLPEKEQVLSTTGASADGYSSLIATTDKPDAKYVFESESFKDATRTDPVVTVTQSTIDNNDTDIYLIEDHSFTTIPTESSEVTTETKSYIESAYGFDMFSSSKYWFNDSTTEYLIATTKHLNSDPQTTEISLAQETTTQCTETMYSTETSEVTTEIESITLSTESTDSAETSSKTAWIYDSTKPASLTNLKQAVEDYATTQITLIEDHAARYAETTMPTVAVEVITENQSTPPNNLSTNDFEESYDISERDDPTTQDSIEATTTQYNEYTEVTVTNNSTAQYDESTLSTESPEVITEIESTTLNTAPFDGSNISSETSWIYDSVTPNLFTHLIQAEKGYETTEISSNEDYTIQTALPTATNDFIFSVDARAPYIATEVGSTNSNFVSTDVYEISTESSIYDSIIFESPGRIRPLQVDYENTEILAEDFFRTTETTSNSHDKTETSVINIEMETTSLKYLSFNADAKPIEKSSSEELTIAQSTQNPIVITSTEILIEEIQSSDSQVEQSATCCSTVDSFTTIVDPYEQDTTTITGNLITPTSDLATDNSIDPLFVITTGAPGTYASTYAFSTDHNNHSLWKRNETSDTTESSGTNSQSVAISSKDDAAIKNEQSVTDANILLKHIKFTYDTDVMPTLDEF
ncbi:mucin-22-like [Eurosta solidaginis]|uniref:mucin-22-like n=1 Tax=Eurosta solidaginis TaxID=178769 RepID=UPI003530DF77